jgi:mannose-6-phosphate isomerase-like protein (cupin superfamily)
MVVTQRNSVPVFVTKDTSLIRELLAPRCAPGAIAAQSLAEATLPPGAATEPHYHPVTEEIYYVLTGTGRMRFPETERRVGPGDAIAIPPGTPHQLINDGETELTLLCCCAPAYSDDDTVMVPAW